METCRQMKNRHQKEFDNFNVKFAFNNEQFDEMLKEFGLTNDNYKDNLISIGYGGFILRKDKEAFIEMNKRHKEERRQQRAETIRRNKEKRRLQNV